MLPYFEACDPELPMAEVRSFPMKSHNSTHWESLRLHRTLSHEDLGNQGPMSRGATGNEEKFEHNFDLFRNALEKYRCFPNPMQSPRYFQYEVSPLRQ